jgi:hypothetical protein
MPNYNCQIPPVAIYPGDTVYAFRMESPSTPQASQQFAIAQCYDGTAGAPAEIRVDIHYETAPTSVSIVVQSAVDDDDLLYCTEYVSTSTTGEMVRIPTFRGRFLRITLQDQAGGGALTVRVQR